MNIILKATPALMGWAITTSVAGVSYMVEGGLKSPDARLKYWEKNKHVIEAAILKAQKGAA